MLRLLPLGRSAALIVRSSYQPSRTFSIYTPCLREAHGSNRWESLAKPLISLLRNPHAKDIKWMERGKKNKKLKKKEP